MTWVRHTDLRTVHRCLAPTTGSFSSPDGQLGDLWRCGECGTLWRIADACDICDQYGPDSHHGGHAVGRAWRIATRWQRLLNWRKGWA